MYNFQLLHIKEVSDVRCFMKTLEVSVRHGDTQLLLAYIGQSSSSISRLKFWKIHVKQGNATSFYYTGRKRHFSTPPLNFHFCVNTVESVKWQQNLIILLNFRTCKSFQSLDSTEVFPMLLPTDVNVLEFVKEWRVNNNTLQISKCQKL